MVFLGDKQEARRHASVLVLAELARHANVKVYPHVGTILNNIWGALREPKVRNAIDVAARSNDRTSSVP